MASILFKEFTFVPIASGSRTSPVYPFIIIGVGKPLIGCFTEIAVFCSFESNRTATKGLSFIVFANPASSLSAE